MEDHSRIHSPSEKGDLAKPLRLGGDEADALGVGSIHLVVQDWEEASYHPARLFLAFLCTPRAREALVLLCYHQYLIPAPKRVSVAAKVWLSWKRIGISRTWTQSYGQVGPVI